MEEAERHEISIGVEGDGKCHLENPGTERKKRKEEGARLKRKVVGRKERWGSCLRNGTLGSRMFQEGFEVAF